jgi:hypothetical protein
LIASNGPSANAEQVRIGRTISSVTVIAWVAACHGKAALGRDTPQRQETPWRCGSWPRGCRDGRPLLSKELAAKWYEPLGNVGYYVRRLHWMDSSQGVERPRSGSG